MRLLLFIFLCSVAARDSAKIHDGGVTRRHRTHGAKIATLAPGAEDRLVERLANLLLSQPDNTVREEDEMQELTNLLNEATGMTSSDPPSEMPPLTGEFVLKKQGHGVVGKGFPNPTRFEPKEHKDKKTTPSKINIGFAAPDFPTPGPLPLEREGFPLPLDLKENVKDFPQPGLFDSKVPKVPKKARARGTPVERSRGRVSWKGVDIDESMEEGNSIQESVDDPTFQTLKHTPNGVDYQYETSSEELLTPDDIATLSNVKEPVQIPPRAQPTRPPPKMGRVKKIREGVTVKVPTDLPKITFAPDPGHVTVKVPTDLPRITFAPDSHVTVKVPEDLPKITFAPDAERTHLQLKISEQALVAASQQLVEQPDDVTRLQLAVSEEALNKAIKETHDALQRSGSTAEPDRTSTTTTPSTAATRTIDEKRRRRLEALGIFPHTQFVVQKGEVPKIHRRMRLRHAEGVRIAARTFTFRPLDLGFINY